MVALRSLFLTGLVAAVNSNGDIMNAGGNPGVITPVSKVSFLQAVQPVTIHQLKQAAGAEQSNFIDLDTCVLGDRDWAYPKSERTFALSVAKAIGAGKLSDEEVTSFKVEPRRVKLATLLADTEHKLQNLSVDDFAGKMWAQADSVYMTKTIEDLKLGEEIRLASVAVKKSGKNDEEYTALQKRKGALEKELVKMESGAVSGPAKDLYYLVAPVSRTVNEIWKAVEDLQAQLKAQKSITDATRTNFSNLGEEGDPLIIAEDPTKVAKQEKAKEADGKRADAFIAARKLALAKIYWAEHSIPEKQGRFCIRQSASCTITAVSPGSFAQLVASKWAPLEWVMTSPWNYTVGWKGDGANSWNILDAEFNRESWISRCVVALAYLLGITVWGSVFGVIYVYASGYTKFSAPVGEEV